MKNILSCFTNEIYDIKFSSLISDGNGDGIKKSSTIPLVLMTF